MIGKQFGQEYINLLEHEENLNFCIDMLSELDEVEKTEKAIEAIKEAKSKIHLRLKELDEYELIKRLP